MKGAVEAIGKAFSFTILGFVLGIYFGGNLVGERYQSAMQEVDHSFRAALGWQAPRDLQTCRQILTAIVMSDPTVLDAAKQQPTRAD